MALILPFIEAEIQDQFIADDNKRPWIIGFSGGKDSTMLLQLVWKAIQKLPEPLRASREVYIVCNDTLVENPRVVRFIEDTLHKIEQATVEYGIPFRIQRTIPRLEDTFWTNLIGKGYPAPSSTFRWCTERLKINPTTHFIQNKITETGEVIILLGTRSAESSARSRSMNKHAVQGQRLRKHPLPNAFVYAPIKDVETNEVWQYLQQVPPPWGGTHKELITLYRNANSGDCPLVMDTTTPSCGNSRFGCWVCTVVNRDKSMEGLIENGEEWMEPLAALRDFLIEMREDMDQYRERRSRTGIIRENAYGPYKPWVRAEVLRRLLDAQREIQQDVDPTMSFITHQELVAIQVIWYRDGIFNQSVSEIYNRVFNRELTMTKHTEKLHEEEKWLREVCAATPDHFDLIQQAVKLVKTKSLMVKKRGLQNDIENLLGSYVRSKKTAAAAVR